MRLGGVGIRISFQIAIPSFLSCAAASDGLVSEMLPVTLCNTVGACNGDFIYVTGAWDGAGGDLLEPTSPWTHKRESWGPIVVSTASVMLD